MQVYYGEDLYMDDKIPFYDSFDEIKKLKEWERRMWRKCTLVAVDENVVDRKNCHYVNLQTREFMLAWSGSPPLYRLENETIVHIPNDPIRTFMNDKTDYDEIYKSL